MSPEEKDEVRKELGDILWQLSGVCKVMGWTFEEVAEENLAKQLTKPCATIARKETGGDSNGE